MNDFALQCRDVRRALPLVFKLFARLDYSPKELRRSFAIELRIGKHNSFNI
jgi:hypothetical protein